MRQHCYFVRKSGVDSPMALITKKSLDGPNRWLKVQIINMHTGHISTGKTTKTQILEQLELIKDMTPATAEEFFYITCNHIDKETSKKKRAIAKALGLEKTSY